MQHIWKKSQVTSCSGHNLTHGTQLFTYVWVYAHHNKWCNRAGSRSKLKAQLLWEEVAFTEFTYLTKQQEIPGFVFVLGLGTRIRWYLAMVYWASYVNLELLYSKYVICFHINSHCWVANRSQYVLQVPGLRREHFTDLISCCLSHCRRGSLVQEYPQPLQPETWGRMGKQ